MMREGGGLRDWWRRVSGEEVVFVGCGCVLLVVSAYIVLLKFSCGKEPTPIQLFSLVRVRNAGFPLNFTTATHSERTQLID